MSGSAQCPHSDIDWHTHLTVMGDSNVASVQITAKCKICGKPMDLARGCILGASSRHPTKASGTEGGILFPMIAIGEEPSKEWGFGIVRTVIGEQP